MKLAFVPFIVCCVSHAFASGPQVVEAKESLLGTKQKRMLEAVDQLPLPVRSDVVRKGEATLVLTAGAAYTDAFLISFAEGDSRKLGSDLASALQGTALEGEKVTFSSEDAYEIAVARHSSGKFGQSSSANSLPVGRIVAALNGTGRDVNLVVRTPKHVQAENSGLPSHESSNWIWYASLNPPSDVALSLKAQLPAYGGVLFILFLLLPGVATFGGIVAAVIYGSRSHIPVERRRKVYAKLSVYPAYGSIMLHMPLAMFFLFGRQYRPYADLWFGTNSAMAMSPFILIPIPLLFLLLPLGSKIETKLFGKPEEEAPPVIEISEDEKGVYKAQSKLQLALFAVGILVFLGLSFAPRPYSEFKLFGFLFILLGGPIATVVYTKKLASFNAAEADPELESAAARLAEAMKVQLKRLKVDGSLLGRQAPTASVSPSNVVIVSARAKEIMTPDELDALIAHELAHIRLGHVKWRRYYLFAVFGFVALVFGLMQLRILFNLQINLSWFFLLMMLTFPLSLLYRTVLSRNAEYKADRLALETTRNPEAFASMLDKLVSNSPLPGIHEIETASSHPAISKRVAAVQEWANVNGFGPPGSELQQVATTV